MLRSVCLLISISLLLGCKPDSDGASDRTSSVGSRTPVVYVVNYPLQYFAERIGGEHIQVEFPIPGDIDPRTWKPEAGDIEKFQSADLILLNGANYAKWTSFASLPGNLLVNTSDNFEDELLEVSDAFVHRHGPEGVKSAKEKAVNVWLDFQLAQKQAEAIQDAFIQLAPEHQVTFEENFAKLASDLKKLDEGFRAAFRRFADQPLIASQPCFQYLARRYEVDIQSITWAPDRIPNSQESEQLEKALKNRPAKWVIWEKNPSPELVNHLREKYSLECLVFLPMSNQQENSPNWLEAMKSNLQSLQNME